MKHGLNTVQRKSLDTPVTVPYDKTFGEADALKTDNSSHGRCGWPHHLLVPKGSAEGFHCQLFVMISNYETDKVSMGKVRDQVYLYFVFPKSRTLETTHTDDS